MIRARQLRHRVLGTQYSVLASLCIIAFVGQTSADDAYFPPPESQRGWRTLAPANETPSAEQKARIREAAGLDWDRLHDAWSYSKSFGNPSSMVIVRHGWIAGEWVTDQNKHGIA